jgi:hypothetical protein
MRAASIQQGRVQPASAIDGFVEKNARGAVRRSPLLLPILERSELEAEPLCELRLAKLHPATDGGDIHFLGLTNDVCDASALVAGAMSFHILDRRRTLQGLAWRGENSDRIMFAITLIQTV